MLPSEQLTVALACADGVGSWPHEAWPTSEDPYVRRVIRVAPPYRALRRAAVDVVLLFCAEPSAAFPALRRALRDRNVPVVVVSPRRDADTVVEVFRAGAGYLVEGDYCLRTLSSAAMTSTVGHTYLSPAACAALCEGARRTPTAADAMARLRSLLSPRERQIMELLSTGLAAQEISLRLSLSEKTVRNNLSNIYAKLDARGGTDAVLRWLGATPATSVQRA